MVHADSCQTVRIQKADEESAIAIVRSHHDKKYSLCGASSFTVMQRLRIAEAVAFDADFRSYRHFTLL